MRERLQTWLEIVKVLAFIAGAFLVMNLFFTIMNALSDRVNAFLAYFYGAIWLPSEPKDRIAILALIVTSLGLAWSILAHIINTHKLAEEKKKQEKDKNQEKELQQRVADLERKLAEHDV